MKRRNLLAAILLAPFAGLIRWFKPRKVWIGNMTSTWDDVNNSRHLPVVQKTLAELNQKNAVLYADPTYGAREGFWSGIDSPYWTPKVYEEAVQTIKQRDRDLDQLGAFFVGECERVGITPDEGLLRLGSQVSMFNLRYQAEHGLPVFTEDGQPYIIPYPVYE